MNSKNKKKPYGGYTPGIGCVTFKKVKNLKTPDLNCIHGFCF